LEALRRWQRRVVAIAGFAFQLVESSLISSARARAHIARHLFWTATCARRATAAPPLIAAAFLHDIAHLFQGEADRLGSWELDRDHAGLAAEWLGRSWGPAVTAPIALHVQAKRYLCSVDHEYAAGLDARSSASLAHQGGRMCLEEVELFSSSPGFVEAVQLRRWDDTDVPNDFEPSEELRGYLLEVLRSTEI
jgi:predicted HD phosphohydrolase